MKIIKYILNKLLPIILVPINKNKIFNTKTLDNLFKFSVLLFIFFMCGSEAFLEGDSDLLENIETVDYSGSEDDKIYLYTGVVFITLGVILYICFHP